MTINSLAEYIGWGIMMMPRNEQGTLSGTTGCVIASVTAPLPGDLDGDVDLRNPAALLANCATAT